MNSKNEFTDHERAELQALRDKLEMERYPTKDAAPKVSLTDLLGRALEYTERERQLEREFSQSREAFEKSTEAATQAWNEYHYALLDYLNQVSSVAINHSEMGRYLAPPNVASEVRGYVLR